MSADVKQARWLSSAAAEVSRKNVIAFRLYIWYGGFLVFVLLFIELFVCLKFAFVFLYFYSDYFKLAHQYDTKPTLTLRPRHN